MAQEGGRYMKYCNQGGDEHTFDESNTCFECGASRQAVYDARYLAKCDKEGIVRVSVKVPAAMAEELKAIAKEMRQR